MRAPRFCGSSISSRRSTKGGSLRTAAALRMSSTSTYSFVPTTATTPCVVVSLTSSRNFCFPTSAQGTRSRFAIALIFSIASPFTPARITIFSMIVPAFNASITGFRPAMIFTAGFRSCALRNGRSLSISSSNISTPQIIKLLKDLFHMSTCLLRGPGAFDDFFLHPAADQKDEDSAQEQVQLTPHVAIDPLYEPEHHGVDSARFKHLRDGVYSPARHCSASAEVNRAKNCSS